MRAPHGADHRPRARRLPAAPARGRHQQAGARGGGLLRKRLQIQEKLTAQIANTIQQVLEPRGVAVVIEAAHQCMTTRGVHKPGVTMVTSRMLGAFRDDPTTRRELLAMIGSGNGMGDEH